MSDGKISKEELSDTLYGELKEFVSAPVADLSALKAIDVTTINNGSFCEVKNTGLFRYDKDSSLANNGLYIIQPNAGSGRWINDDFYNIFYNYFTVHNTTMPTANNYIISETINLMDGLPIKVKFCADSTAAISVTVNGGNAAVLDRSKSAVANVKASVISTLIYSMDLNVFIIQ